MQKKRDYSKHVGEKYGLLTIVEMAEPKVYFTKENYKKERKRFVVKCDCGNIKTVDCTNLLNRNTISCGCFRDKMLPELHKVGHMAKNITDAPLRKLYRNYRATANKKKIEFNITYEEFIEFTSNNCHYCGTEPLRTIKNETGSKTMVVNGIDRLNSSIGYVAGNMVSCCYQCNYAKRDMSVEDFLVFINRVYNWQKNTHV